MRSASLARMNDELDIFVVHGECLIPDLAVDANECRVRLKRLVVIAGVFEVNEKDRLVCCENEAIHFVSQRCCKTDDLKRLSWH